MLGVPGPVVNENALISALLLASGAAGALLPFSQAPAQLLKGCVGGADHGTEAEPLPEAFRAREKR